MAPANCQPGRRVQDPGYFPCETAACGKDILSDLPLRQIEWLLAHYDKPLRVENLAAQVPTSSSTLHLHFRQLAGMSPLQHQKRMRLNEARRLMLPKRLPAALASFRVGYGSPTEFDRKCSRLFGNSPHRDIDDFRSRSNVELPSTSIAANC
ncbi:AraC family transcriptional regulator [Burkholderia sp. Bp8963]|uniref:helix-turn-helix domain-containing protein n=1 Tax=Burkholderia sp. Bp8963 TaxID=2184547 RepID=UPI000F59C252|nr:AraC family transcriptional regulator [Burkholderia sp. Bp8963]RQS65661.1 AraC family transcriptional regulator [Burkholderia sp. Bp8963]